MLVTRPEPAASETARQLESLGFAAVLAPLLRVRALPARLPGRPGAVLATSGNALAALPSHLHDTTLLAVGDATAARAQAAGFRDVRSAAADADALAALAQRTCPAGSLLLLASGRGQGGALAATLRASGFRVHRRAVYAAEAVARFPPAACRAFERGELQAALFLSAETSRAFTQLFPPALCPALAAVDALAIGQPAADALGALPWRRVRVSLRPTLEGVLALL